MNNQIFQSNSRFIFFDYKCLVRVLFKYGVAIILALIFLLGNIWEPFQRGRNYTAFLINRK